MTFVSHMDKVRRTLDSAATTALREVGRTVANQAKRNVTGGGSAADRLNVRGGDLRASIGSEIKTPGLGGTVVVGAATKYAAIHEFGGVIRAKNKPYLMFQTRDGAWHKVKEVRIPARPYLQPAIDDHHDEAAAVFAKTMRQHFGGG